MDQGWGWQDLGADVAIATDLRMDDHWTRYARGNVAGAQCCKTSGQCADSAPRSSAAF
jgi:hypothetical protein